MIVNHNLDAWDSIISKMPALLNALRSDTLRDRRSTGKLPERGIYDFYEGGKPVYVGRTNRMKQRIREHSSPSATKAATFAYLVAKMDLEAKGIEPEAKSGKPSSRITNADLEKYPGIISTARERVGKMQFRVVEISDPIEQTLFEVYAAVQLGTTREQGGYNDFENH